MNKSIRDYFLPKQEPREQLTIRSLRGAAASSEQPPRPNLQSPATLLSSENSLTMPNSSPTSSPPLERNPEPHSLLSQSIIKPSSQLSSLAGNPERVIQASDDEEDIDTDSDLEDLTELLQAQSSGHRSQPTIDSHAPKTPVHKRTTRSSAAIYTSPLALMPKYNNTLSMLVKQAEEHDATEASSLRVQTMLKDAARIQTPPQPNIEDHDSLLESVVADGEGSGMNKVLQAVKRTEATRVEKRWYLFDGEDQETEQRNHAFPIAKVTKDWHREFAEPSRRDQALLSGFAKDMVTLGGSALPEELFMWMLDEVCFERRDDLRHAYYDIISSAPDTLRQFMQPETILRLFRHLGGSEATTDLNMPVRPIFVNHQIYSGREWENLRTVINLLGSIAGNISIDTSVTAMCMLGRLSIDGIVWEDIGLLAALQKALHQISSSIPDNLWEKSCGTIGASIFDTVDQESFRLQVLRCIPSTTPRLHELRRRLALAFFCKDPAFLSQRSTKTFDLWEINKRMTGTRFKIDNNTDYIELAATMRILDIAIDRGQSDHVNLGDSASVQEFNMDVDALDSRIKAIWSKINEKGASFISRIDAKEIMEGARHRLTYTVRTQPRPVQWLLQGKGEDKEEDIQKQADVMSRFFKRVKTENPVDNSLPIVS